MLSNNLYDTVTLDLSNINISIKKNIADDLFKKLKKLNQTRR